MGAEVEEETQVITVQASRVNEKYTEQMLARVGDRYGVRIWVRRRELGWLKREFTVTVRGHPERIADLIEVLDAPRTIGGDTGPGFF